MDGRFDDRTANVGAARSCACGWLLPAATVPVRARTGFARAPVRVTLDEVEGQRVVDAYVALACPACGAGHVLHTVDSAIRAGLVETDLSDCELAARAGRRSGATEAVGSMGRTSAWEPAARALAVALDSLRGRMDDRGDGEEVRLGAVAAYEAHCARLAVAPWPPQPIEATCEEEVAVDLEPAARTVYPLKPYRMELAAAGHCMADSDGDCTWEGCPQLRDGEPARTSRHCPRDVATRARLDPDDEGRAGG